MEFQMIETGWLSILPPLIPIITMICETKGADCKHVRHVETQLPYATLVAVICAAGYLIAGFTHVPWIALCVHGMTYRSLRILLFTSCRYFAISFLISSRTP